MVDTFGSTDLAFSTTEARTNGHSLSIWKATTMLKCEEGTRWEDVSQVNFG